MKQPCPACPSSDAFEVYDDGHGHCYACGHHTSAPGQPNPQRSKPRIPSDILSGIEYRPLNARRLREDTLKKFGYGVSSYQGKAVQVAQFKDNQGQVIAQKIRTADKKFLYLGDSQAVGLYGQWLWRDKGKRIIITEGEIDALSVSQSQQNKWPVVSLPNGAQSAEKAIKKALDWLEGFETVVLCFDQDEPGQTAAEKVAPLFSPGKCKIACLPTGFKDANDMIKAGKDAELQECLWGAKTYRPDGIVNGADLWEQVKAGPGDPGTPYPWAGLNDKLLGMRPGEIVTITAGSGVGKSQVCRELAKHLHDKGDSIGYIALEENNSRTALGFVGLELDTPLHLSAAEVSEEELETAFKSSVGSGRFFLYDHWGSASSSSLLSRIRYLAKSCDCRWVVLDHLSIVVSGVADGDERRIIDNLMTDLRCLVEETQIGLILVVHLKRPGMGKGWNEGRQVTLSDLRGSAAIEQLSDVAVGVERNQHDEKNPDLSTIRVLKNRYAGLVGKACLLQYNHETGRMMEFTEPPDFGPDDGDKEMF